MFKLILLALSLLLAGPGLAQTKSKVNEPDARLTGLSRSTKRPNNKISFRKEHPGLGLDLHKHDPAKFKTAKANRNYTYGQPGKNRVSRANKNPIISLGKGGKRRGSRTLGQ